MLKKYMIFSVLLLSSFSLSLQAAVEDPDNEIGMPVSEILPKVKTIKPVSGVPAFTRNPNWTSTTYHKQDADGCVHKVTITKSTPSVNSSGMSSYQWTQKDIITKCPRYPNCIGTKTFTSGTYTYMDSNEWRPTRPSEPEKKRIKKHREN